MSCCETCANVNEHIASYYDADDILRKHIVRFCSVKSIRLDDNVPRDRCSQYKNVVGGN